MQFTFALFAVCAIATTVAQQDYNNYYQNPLWATSGAGTGAGAWSQQASPAQGWPQQQVQSGDYYNNGFSLWPGSGRSANTVVSGAADNQQDDGSWKPDVNEDRSGDWSPQQYNRRRRSAAENMLRTFSRK